MGVGTAGLIMIESLHLHFHKCCEVSESYTSLNLEKRYLGENGFCN